MFGIVPKSIWNKLNPADENNMCSWAMRCLLIEDSNRLILIDNGMGNKQDEKFFGYYYLHGNDSLDGSLNKIGFHRDDVTDVFLTHLHFDHCGGSIQFNRDKTGYEPAFKNAVYWSNEQHWEWATHPNSREKPSFLKENIMPIRESGQLKFINNGDELYKGFKYRIVNGHTESMMLPEIEYKGKKVIYLADLIPSIGHVPLAYIMGYDLRPLETLKEKEILYCEYLNQDAVLFFEHDPDFGCCNLQQTDRGVRVKEKFQLEEYFGDF